MDDEMASQEYKEKIMLNKGNGHLTKDLSLPRARSIDLITREMVDEVLIYDLKRHKAHCLNQTAAMVWKHCDGQKTVGEIAELIEKDVNVTVSEATVWLAVERLGKAHLLHERVIPPAGSPRLSRREAVMKLGMSAALAVPVVMSIVSPAAATAASCVATGMTTSCYSSTNNSCCTMCCNTSVNPDKCLAKHLSSGASCVKDCQCNSGHCNSGCCS